MSAHCLRDQVHSDVLSCPGKRHQQNTIPVNLQFENPTLAEGGVLKKKTFTSYRFYKKEISKLKICTLGLYILIFDYFK